MANQHETLRGLFDDIATSIKNKGVAGQETGGKMQADKFPDYIDSIIQGSGNAQPADVRSGKTFANSSGAQTGEMPNATIDVTDKSITAGTLSGSWDATNNKYNITQAKKTDTMQSTVTTAGYISSSEGTKNTGSLTINGASLSIPGTNVVEKAGAISGTTYTQGKVTVDTAGYIPTGDKIDGATFGNTGTTGTTYKDISGTTAAPELVSGDYLYINKGYTDNVKISLAKLIPDAHGADIASDKILQGYDAYDKDGNVVAGSIPTKTDSGNVTLNASTTSKSYPAGYYPNAHGASHSTASRANTTLSSSADTTNAKLTFTASNNQSTGFVTGANKTATATVTLTASGPTVTASDGTNSVSKTVASGSASKSSNKVLITAGYIPAQTITVGTAKAAATYNTSTSDQTIAAGYYLTGAQTIKAVTTSNISAANIKAGVNVKVGDANSLGRIKNVTGTFTSDATATAENLYKGTTAYVNGSKVTGTAEVTAELISGTNYNLIMPTGLITVS